MSNFRTIEISNPRFEQQNLRFITVKSNALKHRADICLFVPDHLSELKNLPVCILLHGVYGSAWSWAFCSGVHLQAKKMMEEGTLSPMILAMPSDGLWGDGSAYLPHKIANYEKWIAQDVPEVLIEVLEQVSDQSAFFITGLSMGGFGALRIGAKYHQRFQGMSGLSSITQLEEMELFNEEGLQSFKAEGKSDESVFETLLKYKETLPPFTFNCGRSDLLIEQNRKLHQQLVKHQISHTYEEFEGAHEWDYWEKRIAASLLFFNRLL